eukprot:CAMPEP_0197185042 /NCGR_PEP_ID=MMETSP1423-20130617/11104_1 /TAXON_ID=476441 /ORGANISM="Pseudo-nitzschia heimii, Strain UNC1101" /LENGTH=489 /DNA_ID=CAMNT_0042636005 /DNA_START=216 /DNA_END=1688 /DNA_ORIENTATION=-
MGSNEALADAFSGVIGTLVSLWCFYPIERIKTNLQAGKSLPKSLSSGTLSKAGPHNNDANTIQKKAEVYFDFFEQLFRGCLTKSMHATASSFCYFYFYSWILSHYNNKQRLRIQSKGGKSKHLRPSTLLFLSAIAAMMNTVVTLPLDVLSSKRTVESDSDNTESETSTIEITEIEENRKKMDEAWKLLGESGDKSPPGLSTFTGSSSSSSASSGIEVEFHEACSRSEDLFSLHNEIENNEKEINTSIISGSASNASTTSTSSILSNNKEYKLRWKERLEQRKSRRLCRKGQLQLNAIPNQESPNSSAENVTKTTSATNIIPTKFKPADDIIVSIRRWSKLWKGLAPALLLCSNPSIHYTVFDMLKSKVLTWKSPRYGSKSQKHIQLSVSEAFVLGLLSKFAATILTYPLIRAKVLMMLQEDPTPNTQSTSTSSPNLWSVLKQSYYQDGGIPGLYKGCDWQLMHTLLKSALMMAIRERITDKTRALFGVR